jgi:hypothetical protein
MPAAPDLTDAERAAVVALLKRAIAESRYPFSPEIRTLKRALDKLEPPPARPQPHPAPKPAGEPSLLYRKLRGGGRRRR